MITNSKIEELCITPDETLYRALEVINTFGDSSSKLALVIDDNSKLLGVINDGDIRRALLGRNSLDTPVSEFMKKDFVYIEEGMARSAVLDIMRSLCVDQIPVLDKQGRVISLHLLREMLSVEPLLNSALIMAGGKGTRLYPITENIPKPMVRVAGRPILEHTIHHLVGHGITNVYLSVNYMAEVIEGYFGDGSQFGCKINYLREDKPLGTAGALSLLPQQEHDVILMNGDLITQFDVQTMLQVHKLRSNSITIGARDHVTHIAYGVLDVDDGHVVNGVSEKPELHHLVNGGVYVISPESLEFIPSDSMYFATDLIDDCFKKDMKVGYHLLEEDWVDVGEHKQLATARGEN